MVYPKQQNGDHLKVKALYKTRFDYNGEGRKWEFVTTMTTKHEHTKHNLEYNESTSTPHEPRTMYHESRRHQHHKPRTTRMASSRTRDDERGHQHHGPRTTRTTSTWACNDERSEATPDQRASGSRAPTPSQGHGHTSR